MRLCVLTSRRADGTYVAVCPSLPGCITHAKTHRQVLKLHREAVIGYIASVSDAVPTRVRFDVINERRNAALRRIQNDENMLSRHENRLNFQETTVR